MDTIGECLPDMTLADDEHQEIKDTAEKEWTDEVKSAWTTLQELNPIPSVDR